MTGRTHLTFGIGIGLIGMATCHLVTGDINASSSILAGCAIGSLFPDLDIPNSTISKYIPIIPNIINKMFGHRNFFHSPIFLLLLYFLLSYFFPKHIFLIYGFIIGFISHLLLDTFNKGGIPLLYPFSRKRFNLFSVKSGSKNELLIAMIVYLFFFAGFIWFLAKAFMLANINF